MRKTVFRGTWLERSGKCTVYHMAKKGSIGKRVVVQVWDDAPTAAVLQVMSGTFWRGRPRGVIFERVLLIDYTEETLVSEVKRLSTKHFNWSE